ncbi:MAG: hypothetical protein RIR25_367 [Verrucomicrobiota bacterium]
MKHIFAVARILLGIIFLIFSLNYWVHLIPIPASAEGSMAAGYMGAIYGSGSLTIVKVIELIGAVLLLSGCFVNLGLTLLGPIVVNILLFHILIAHDNCTLPVIIAVLALITLLGRKNYLRVILAR